LSVTRFPSSAAADLVHDAFAILRWRLWVLFALMFLSGLFEGLGLTMLFPVLARFGIGKGGDGALERMIDRTLVTLGLPNELSFLLVATVGLLYAQVVFQTARSWMTADCQTRYTSVWQRRMFDAFMDAEWRFFLNVAPSVRVNAIINETARASAAFHLFMEMATACLFIVVYAAVSLLAAWQVVVFLGVFGILIYFAVRPLSGRGAAIGEGLRDVNEKLQQRSSEFLAAAKLIKATATEARVQQLFATAAENYRINYRAAAFHPKLVYGVYIMAGYTLLGIGVWGAVMWLNLVPAGILLATYVFLRLYVQVPNLQQYSQGFVVALPAFVALQKEFSQARSSSERLGGSEPVPDGPAFIELSRISVHYPARSALDEVSVEFPAGLVIGVTGPSGSGKTTLVDLIVGLIKPDSGMLKIDDVPIDDLQLRQWRQSIGYVGQDTLLLDGTIAQNIGWGSAGDPGDIERAARAAQIHQFVESLPQGYETEVGDRGIRLSGGQRQRVGLARALMGSKRLLILDEATSALDSANEREVMQALRQLKGQITIVMVAHRLSTLQIADRIVVLDQGKMVETGTWDELLAAGGGTFAKLWQVQKVGAEA
jgi:ABC-type multidrug transport system fused ATPase/permease subunit